MAAICLVLVQNETAQHISKNIDLLVVSLCERDCVSLSVCGVHCVEHPKQQQQQKGEPLAPFPGCVALYRHTIRSPAFLHCL